VTSSSKGTSRDRPAKCLACGKRFDITVGMEVETPCPACGEWASLLIGYRASEFQYDLMDIASDATQIASSAGESTRKDGGER
jgi:predicted RNA-binding Zn-ribbon protein involved in translation (DUF1610 family)